ncbi:MAG: preprotein translocase subunit YajC [Spirochaetaceae bacterium]|jgi:preprotein translocase subunit YajC|nr:preprotein translocase subunit YajC [Spirochaetaceae bacterium]
MELFSLPLLLGGAQGGGGAPASGTEQILSFAPFILIIAIFYFLIIRPQNKKQKETQKMLSALKKGDKVVTIGGVHGTISSVKENSVLLKVDDNVKIEFSRSAIASVSFVAKEEKSKEEKPEAQAAIEDKKEDKKTDSKKTEDEKDENEETEAGETSS